MGAQGERLVSVPTGNGEPDLVAGSDGIARWASDGSPVTYSETRGYVDGAGATRARNADDIRAGQVLRTVIHRNGLRVADAPEDRFLAIDRSVGVAFWSVRA